jgi:hypothetical protein
MSFVSLRYELTQMPRYVSVTQQYENSSAHTIVWLNDFLFPSPHPYIDEACCQLSQGVRRYEGTASK